MSSNSTRLLLIFLRLYVEALFGLVLVFPTIYGKDYKETPQELGYFLLMIFGGGFVGGLTLLGMNWGAYKAEMLGDYSGRKWGSA